MREKKSGNATPHIKNPQNQREIEKLTEMKREREEEEEKQKP